MILDLTIVLILVGIYFLARKETYISQLLDALTLLVIWNFIYLDIDYRYLIIVIFLNYILRQFTNKITKKTVEYGIISSLINLMSIALLSYMLFMCIIFFKTNMDSKYLDNQINKSYYIKIYTKLPYLMSDKYYKTYQKFVNEYEINYVKNKVLNQIEE